jgi:uncharacterized protein (TIGR02145 family)
MKKRSIFAIVCALGAMIACGKGGGTTEPIEPDETGVSIGGVTWATRNVGTPGEFAANPEDYGMYYQFDRRIGWNDSSDSSDGSSWSGRNPVAGAWSPQNDPCPNGWRLPTNEEHRLLLEATTVSWETINGVTGVRLTEEAGANSIFMPSAGNIKEDGEKFPHGTIGFYWSSTLYGDGSIFGCYLYISDTLLRYDDGIQYGCACSVRCVLKE